MGYTSIAQTPVVTGLYTVIFPTLVFALLGSSRLLVVGADSATAAMLAAGLRGLGDRRTHAGLAGVVGLPACRAGLRRPAARRAAAAGSASSVTSCSASVLVGFLTGVGIQVLTGQIPDMLGIPKGSGNWFEQQWDWIPRAHRAAWTPSRSRRHLVIIFGFKRFVPRCAGRRRRGCC